MVVQGAWNIWANHGDKMSSNEHPRCFSFCNSRNRTKTMLSYYTAVHIWLVNKISFEICWEGVTAWGLIPSLWLVFSCDWWKSIHVAVMVSIKLPSLPTGLFLNLCSLWTCFLWCSLETVFPYQRYFSHPPFSCCQNKKTTSKYIYFQLRIL